MTKPPADRANRPVLALHVPEPTYRPGDTPDFSSIAVPVAGTAPRPDVAAKAEKTFPLCNHLVRVLDDDGKAVGAWDPKLDPDTLRKMLKDMK
ncbi:MAG TPA: 3-methyl-2-oxobutanoate dehydrogenase (2-methylpropanoyl-transferring) subunit alpha, partial [Sphingomicrobium sp.]|nr:3-methyl-2-oxobutanoate dehydrogenase (2-methylpropanoyl-transferring) subunit alpha [Sphingomicrobium sp.]